MVLCPFGDGIVPWKRFQGSALHYNRFSPALQPVFIKKAGTQVLFCVPVILSDSRGSFEGVSRHREASQRNSLRSRR